jgi:hypothetical protein
MRGRELLSRLREEILVGDGALGTMISERGIGRDTNYEHLNLSSPEIIQDIHAAYLEAGSQVLETNTFGANRTKLALCGFGDDVEAINRAGVALAKAVAGTKAYVAGSVGTLAGLRPTRATSLVPSTSARARAWKPAIVPQPTMAQPRGRFGVVRSTLDMKAISARAWNAEKVGIVSQTRAGRQENDRVGFVDSSARGKTEFSPPERPIINGSTRLRSSRGNGGAEPGRPGR